jgi:hypothetical protein
MPAILSAPTRRLAAGFPPYRRRRRGAEPCRPAREGGARRRDGRTDVRGAPGSPVTVHALLRVCLVSRKGIKKKYL